MKHISLIAFLYFVSIDVFCQSSESLVMPVYAVSSNTGSYTLGATLPVMNVETADRTLFIGNPFFYFLSEDATSIDEIPEQELLLCDGNRAITICPGNNDADLNVFTPSGMLIKSFQLKGTSAQTVVPLDAGTYIVRVVIAGRIITKKVSVH